MKASFTKALAPVRRVVDRVQKMNPAWINPMHGGSFTRQHAPKFYRALQEENLPITECFLGANCKPNARRLNDLSEGSALSHC
jgi:hypothetical protein